MSRWFKRKTMKARHFVVRLVAPTIYHNMTYAVTRPTIEFVKQREGNKPLRGAEIGVYKGVNARNIVNTLNMKKLFLVDPYTPYSEIQEGFELEDLIKAKDEALCACGVYPSCEFIFKPSVEASKEVMDDSLDFVYVDGNHNYQAVIDDLNAWYQKVRVNGVLGGHNFHAPYFGVCKAVLEFTEKNRLELQGKFGDWWFIS